MPKETKKFINPLLRPSASADARPAPSSQPAVAEEAEEKSSGESSAKYSEEQPESTRVEDTQSSVETTSQARADEKDAENTPSIAEPSSSSARRSSANKSQSSREVTQNRGQVRSNQSTSSEDVVSYARTRPLAEPVDFSSEDYALETPFGNYDPTTSTENSHTGARRPRNPQQSFEMTHARITLWMDKQLKQRFEALASQRELPKTALINEAVSALLKKYETR
ncbi:hypothetical protein [Dictyobacter aurantiacus]|uniref:Uncharacterized protein n=1 Tax=Dictyobacter aurantiacus TaxID=1936993 RepID=A0A401ZPX4_9CHLR|nr:hypothetical protein [Dictyobacter aurantiacus]GCE08882.1 hypothetical protein KDAU_62110 [Dictyobacter aurantiacus]